MTPEVPTINEIAYQAMDRLRRLDIIAEVIATLRALKYLKSDLQQIAGAVAEEPEAADTSEEIADRVEAVFSDLDKTPDTSAPGKGADNHEQKDEQ